MIGIVIGLVVLWLVTGAAIGYSIYHTINKEDEENEK
jgi:hypothetical protein